jgi:cytochrome c-type biogenesis protein CcmH/NrfF
MFARSNATRPDAPDVRRIKAVIRKRIAEGATPAEIKAELVSQFGPDVLSISPRKKRALAWSLTIGLLLAGAAIVWSRNRRRRGAEAPRDEERADQQLPPAPQPEPLELPRESLPTTAPVVPARGPGAP